MIERRKQARATISYPVYFIGSDKEGNVTAQDIATGLNINDSGMLIESASFINARYITIMATTTRKETVKIDGEIIYSMPAGEDRFRTGVAFQGPSDKIRLFTGSLLKPSPANG